jgi:hypothetical protein
VGEMERKKYLLIPYFFNLGAMLLTEYIVQNGLGFEANPVLAAFYGWLGHFLFMPIVGAFIFFLVMPKFIDWLISKVKDGEDYRRQFEWLLISIAFIMMFIDFSHDLIFLVSVM